jgi:predicted metal-dependent hydrolase
VDYKFGQFTPEHLAKIQEGVELFNEQKYWECHESLEDLWMEDKNDSARYIYWAIIQVAAACIHYRDSKIIGAQGMINKAREKFRRTRELHVLTPIVLKYLDWEELEALVAQIKEKDAKLEDFEELYNFRFKNYRSIPE